MIKFTRKALNIVKELSNEKGKDKVLRISIKGGGCKGFNFYLNFTAVENLDDLIFNFNGIIIVVDVFTMLIFNNILVDYEDAHKAFKFYSNLKKTCDCKSSVSEK